jgi:hypothetical protein
LRKNGYNPLTIISFALQSDDALIMEFDGGGYYNFQKIFDSANKISELKLVITHLKETGKKTIS